MSIDSIFLPGLSVALGLPKATEHVGRSHGIGDIGMPTIERVDAVNFALNHDDGSRLAGLDSSGPDPGRGVAHRQDADLPVPGPAVRGARGQLPADRGRLPGRAAAGAAARACAGTCSD
jgi:hypothetical protein